MKKVVLNAGSAITIGFKKYILLRLCKVYDFTTMMVRLILYSGRTDQIPFLNFLVGSKNKQML